MRAAHIKQLFDDCATNKITVDQLVDGIINHCDKRTNALLARIAAKIPDSNIPAHRIIRNAIKVIK